VGDGGGVVGVLEGILGEGSFEVLGGGV